MKNLKLFLGFIAFSLILQVNAQTSTWNGSAAQWTNGNGTQSNPYLIENAEHLAYLSQQVVIGQKFTGQHFKLMTNINLNNLEWLPIGGRDMQGNGTSTMYFSGIFDGNNKTISNLKITANDKHYTGLFGCVENYTTGITPEIKNLDVVSGTVNGNSSSAGIVGHLKGRIMNCSNSANIYVHSGGGIVGQGSFGCEIIKCTNNGNVFGYNVGGIVATAYDCLIQNCINNGTIDGDDDYASGIVETADGIILNCTNNGNVLGGNIAGIVRYDLGDGVSVLNCVNNGNLTGSRTIGGIGSYIDETSSIINNCYNTGTLNRGGGIVGKAEKCRIENCYNVGTISSSSNSGAIVGALSDNATVTNCHYLNTCISVNNAYGISQTSTNMKTSLFVTTLNASQNPAPWKIGGSQNNGYPILVLSPYIKTIPATDITGNYATLNGHIETGNELISSQGFRYKKYGTTNYTTINISGNTLSLVITCEPLSGYLFQTFATTASGTYYGEELSFTTTDITGINEIVTQLNNAFPNPTNSLINIPYSTDDKTLLKIINAYGQIVSTINLDAGENVIVINVSNYKSGIYIYKFDNFVGKFIVK